VEFNGVNVTGPVEVRAGEVRVAGVRLGEGEQYLKWVGEVGVMDVRAIAAVEHR
jgi:hypothetical protein